MGKCLKNQVWKVQADLIKYMTKNFVFIPEQYILIAGGYPDRDSVELLSLDPSRPVPECLQEMPTLLDGGRQEFAGAGSLLPGGWNNLY